jgi:hypothetical protein
LSYQPENQGQARGFLLSVLGSAAAVATVFAGLMVVDDTSADFVGLVTILVWAFLISAVVIMVVAAVVGLPLTYFLAQHRLERSWTYPVAGFVIGGALFMGLEALFGWRWNLLDLWLILVGALPGAFCGAIWWFSFRSLKVVDRSGANL